MKHKIACSILIVIIFNLFAPFIALANNDDDAIIVKIGYSNNYGIIKTPRFDGHEGFGYEYLHKIIEHTQGNYILEFVECTLVEGVEMLRKNEIDILAPMNYNDSRDNEFIFSQEVFARDALFLNSLKGVNVNEESYFNLNNSRIAVQVGDNTVNYVNNFLDEYKLTATVTVVDINDHTKDDLISNFDYLIADSMQMNFDFDVAINLDINDVFLMGNKNSQPIIEDFDYAMAQISINEYLFKEHLYVKYFDFTINSYEYVSDREYKILQDAGTFNVGVTSLYTTFGYDQINSIAGLPYDIVNFLADESGMDIYFHKITDTTISQMIDGYDFYLPPIGYNESNDKPKSNPYLSTPLLIITNVNSNLKESSTGVIKDYMLEDEVVTHLTSNEKIISYDGLAEVCKAFQKGHVDTIIMAETAYSCAYNYIQSISHTVDVSDYQIDAVIVFSQDFPVEYIDIINKMLTHINYEDIEVFNIRNSSLISEADKSSFFQVYLRAFIILAIIVVVILVQTNNNRTKALEKISAYDELTGVFTQKKFIEETLKILEENPNFRYTIMFIDIDNFKYINEIYSYEVGSNILKIIANAIQNTIDRSLPLARPSADNFLVLVPTDDLFSHIHSYMRADNPIYSEINELVSEHYSINFSIGSYDIIDKSLDVAYMIDCCKLAHSFSKMELGTTYKGFSEDMKTKEATKNSIISRMNQALKDQEFVIYYQPKFDITTKKITGAEGLVRWFSNGGMIPPNDFIPLFEQNGFIENLDYYVVERACEFIKNNPDTNMPVLSVNLSGITIMKNDVVSRIMEIVKRNGISPTQLDLEITESAFVDHFEMAIESIDKFRDLGFTISMDDFGAGISSLNRLKEISIDILKIDREFIVGSLENEKGSTIIRNIILMAKDLRLETVAEGIETDEQLNFLRNLGCDIGQGYYFSRPLPQEEFLKKLSKE